MTKEQKLDELIKEIEKKDKARGLSDEYLREHHYMTREELGIGEYSYGVIMIPTDFVLDYLKELQEQQEENKKKDKTINEMARFITNKDIDEDICRYQVAEHCKDEEYGVTTNVCINCIKQYFENKAKE